MQHNLWKLYIWLYVWHKLWKSQNFIWKYVHLWDHWKSLSRTICWHSPNCWYFLKRVIVFGKATLTHRRLSQKCSYLIRDMCISGIIGNHEVGNLNISLDVWQKIEATRGVYTAGGKSWSTAPGNTCGLLNGLLEPLVDKQLLRKNPVNIAFAKTSAVASSMSGGRSFLTARWIFSNKKKLQNPPCIFQPSSWKNTPGR